MHHQAHQAIDSIIFLRLSVWSMVYGMLSEEDPLKASGEVVSDKATSLNPFRQ
jgi:hypothetical protein